MVIVNPDSLSLTLDGLNEAFFYGRSLPRSDREQAARWIAGRQGLPRSYAGMFAPTERDFAEGAALFTGESARSNAGLSCKLGQEALRALILLDVPRPRVQEALSRATEGMLARLEGAERRESVGSGFYCCGSCSVALWRLLAAGGLGNTEARLAAGMTILESRRDGRGRWRGFPFYYTLLALTGIEVPLALAEIQYAAPACERSLRRPPGPGKFAQRRRDVIERILARG